MCRKRTQNPFGICSQCSALVGNLIVFVLCPIQLGPLFLYVDTRKQIYGSGSCGLFSQECKTHFIGKNQKLFSFSNTTVPFTEIVNLHQSRPDPVADSWPDLQMAAPLRMPPTYLSILRLVQHFTVVRKLVTPLDSIY